MLPTLAKRAIIASGLYRPAQWVRRHISAPQGQVHRDGVAFYRSLLSLGSLCFDVGANVGARSEELIEAGMRVIAFEPNPRVLPTLRAQCAHSDRWTLIQAAVGRESGVAILNAPDAHQQASLVPGWEGLEAKETFPVPVITLDAAIATYGVPDYCKIDVEGYELEVLKGLSASVPLLSMEFHLETPEKIAAARACLEHLTTFGPAQVNIALAETPRLHLAEWVPLDRFTQQFPGDLRRLMPYGDVFVRRDA